MTTMVTRVISPHLDDAVLALGQMLAVMTGDVQVVTVFAGIPAGDVTDYDRSCGFASSRDAMVARREEDVAACAALGVEPVHLPYLDGQYAARTVAERSRIVRSLRSCWDGDADVFAPLGIGHPDHRLVGWAALRACPTVPDHNGIVLYEELPYRVLHPEEVMGALARVRAECEVAALPDPIPVGDRAQKMAAIAAYRSQFPAGADDPCLLVPERAWRMLRRQKADVCG